MAELGWIVVFTVEMALIATVLNVPLALALAAGVERLSVRWRTLVDAVASLPLVLPPTAVGFLLLELLSRYGPVGRALDRAGVEILFTPRAVVLATAVMSFPLMYRAFRIALGGADRRYAEVARTLGASPAGAFLRVTLPLAWPGMASGIVLAWCRAIGEFGATILIAGNIPGRTQTLALAIYQAVQTGRERDAVPLIVLAVAVALAAIGASEMLLRRQREHRA
ncbi:MAG TPA: molybdate ABC transporter permease subunit [Thermoanaerobaculia bacterium]|nr:molybdate ABC transporter permease subunit [Thermoanaerobaculia bacterium]